MNRFITKEVNKLFSKDLSITKIIEQFKKLIEILQLVDKLIIFESLIMFNEISNYLQLSLFTNINENNSTFQLRLDLKYTITPSMLLLQNFFFSDCEKDFWNRIYNTTIIKYISNNNLKPYDVSILEMEV